MIIFRFSRAKIPFKRATSTQKVHSFKVSKQRKNTKSPIRMEILKLIHNNLQIIGMDTYQSIQKYPFNARNLTSLLIYGINIIFNIRLLISGTKNAMEFTDLLYLTFTVIITVSMFINLNWNMKRLFEFFESLESTVDQSEYGFKMNI